MILCNSTKCFVRVFKGKSKKLRNDRFESQQSKIMLVQEKVLIYWKYNCFPFPFLFWRVKPNLISASLKIFRQPSLHLMFNTWIPIPFYISAPVWDSVWQIQASSSVSPSPDSQPSLNAFSPVAFPYSSFCHLPRWNHSCSSDTPASLSQFLCFLCHLEIGGQLLGGNSLCHVDLRVRIQAIGLGSTLTLWAISLALICFENCFFKSLNLGLETLLSG